jgi:hypothetical protein
MKSLLSVAKRPNYWPQNPKWAAKQFCFSQLRKFFHQGPKFVIDLTEGFWYVLAMQQMYLSYFFRKA